MTDKPQDGGLTEGLGIEADEAPSRTSRYEIGGTAAPRQTIDAGWSKNKKLGVGVGAGVLALVAIGAGTWFALDAQPPKLPESAEQAVAVIQSAKFERLDEQRKRQYLFAANELFRELTPEERRALINEDNREAFGEMRQEAMFEMARSMARGEMPDFSQMRPPGGRPGGGGGEGRSDRSEMTDEERDAFRDRMRDRMNERIAEAISSGNSQNFGLMGEMMSGRGGPGRGGPGRGGRGPGGRGAGGGGGRD